MARVARHLMIHGRVQGVWYRAWTVETARALHVSGWVRNRLDGSVEAHVEGDAAAVDAFLVHARQGPPAAQVDRIDVDDIAPSGLTGFEKHPTG
ncbi:acylphosphatase [Sphingobium sp. OAS761]|uniref:acylphosphatase n=1 Tax=Sphingobium sp. OAS761 TaxID=2817901 RepID=UPI0020A186CC|nr:acylphosphatase [Sphingobium sp. OAS761]MCP1469721.1 acylphosphatase [Sphingobium sp. OAS761]